MPRLPKKDPRGAPLKHDYYQLHKQFNREPDLTLAQWVEQESKHLGVQLNYFQMSRHFARIDREIDEAMISRVKKKFRDNLVRIADGINLDSFDEDKEVAFKNRKLVLEVMGMVGKVDKSMNVQNAVIIPALFANSYSGDAERMLGGAIDISPGEGTGRDIKKNGVEPGQD